VISPSTITVEQNSRSPVCCIGSKTEELPSLSIECIGDTLPTGSERVYDRRFNLSIFD